MYIDCHVHLRDFEQKYKETVLHGLEVALDSGVDAVFDMPNTNPPIMTLEIVENRLALAKNANSPIFYGLYMGLTKNPEQIKRGVEAYRRFFPRVVGFKLYAGHSVGDLGVILPEDQFIVYETLTQEGYNGVLAVHSEKESLMDAKKFNPLQPITHCYARPEKAEIDSVKDQTHFAYATRFPGKLHVAHISSPKAVELVNEAKQKGLDISCGVCPHHFIYDWQAMYSNEGILMKMNPPLRSPESQEQMFRYLKEGKIDWIETDHAPHSLEEKTQNPFMSGIPGLPWWPLFEEFLKQNNFTNQQIKDLTFNNIAKRFKIDIPRTRRQIKDRRKDYSFNPYKEIEKQLGW